MNDAITQGDGKDMTTGNYTNPDKMQSNYLMLTLHVYVQWSNNRPRA